MSESSERYRTIADDFGAQVRGVAPDQWSAPTPCSDWAVRDLVAHVIGTHRRVIATLHATDPVEVDPKGDLPGQWLAASGAIAKAMDDETQASKVVGGMFGEQPFESLVARLVCTDTLVHGWDLARATGQDEQLDPQAVSRSMDFLAPIDEAIRRPGGFGAKITPPAGSDEQTRFLNFCGRAV
jgi:uncharacterized protein (TIGR03086 family)